MNVCITIKQRLIWNIIGIMIRFYCSWYCSWCCNKLARVVIYLQLIMDDRQTTCRRHVVCRRQCRHCFGVNSQCVLDMSGRQPRHVSSMSGVSVMSPLPADTTQPTFAAKIICNGVTLRYAHRTTRSSNRISSSTALRMRSFRPLLAPMHVWNCATSALCSASCCGRCAAGMGPCG